MGGEARQGSQVRGGPACGPPVDPVRHGRCLAVGRDPGRGRRAQAGAGEGEETTCERRDRDPTRDRPAPSRAHGGRLRRRRCALRLVRRVLSVRRGPGHVQGTPAGPAESAAARRRLDHMAIPRGSRAGKSRSVTEWVRHQVETGKAGRVALVAPRRPTCAGRRGRGTRGDTGGFPAMVPAEI